MTTPNQLKKLYENGENISKFLRNEQGLKHNTFEIIEIAYDLQTGSYISAMDNKEVRQHKDNYSREIANTILSLCNPSSVLEAGVGEATTLSGVLKNLGNKIDSYGFDLSWSRVAYAKKWLAKNGITSTVLCTGNLFQIPFLDNSIDVVYTSHSIEPNGGKEEDILKELYRVTRKYLILLEPGYEFANDESKQRMDSHGYCKHLKKISESLNYEVIEHKLFPFCVNPSNPTAITIICKDVDIEVPSNVLACPKLKTPLEKIENTLFSTESLSVYPIIGDIPCLRVDNSIFASKYKEYMR